MSDAGAAHPHERARHPSPRSKSSDGHGQRLSPLIEEGLVPAAPRSTSCSVPRLGARILPGSPASSSPALRRRWAAAGIGRFQRQMTIAAAVIGATCAPASRTARAATATDRGDVGAFRLPSRRPPLMGGRFHAGAGARALRTAGPLGAPARARGGSPRVAQSRSHSPERDARRSWSSGRGRPHGPRRGSPPADPRGVASDTVAGAVRHPEYQSSTSPPGSRPSRSATLVSSPAGSATKTRRERPARDPGTPGAVEPPLEPREGVPDPGVVACRAVPVLLARLHVICGRRPSSSPDAQEHARAHPRAVPPARRGRGRARGTWPRSRGRWHPPPRGAGGPPRR